MVKRIEQRTNNDLQNTTQNTKDRATRAALNTEYELGCYEMITSSCSTCDTSRAGLVTNSAIRYE
jgi:hypothetical protein